MQNNKSALYAGSFDPFHPGHQAVVEKALQLFETLYLVVTWNPDKDNKERVEANYTALCNLYANKPEVIVLQNTTQLTAHLAQELNVKWLIRSARNNTDYNYELELAYGNKSLNPELETILIVPDCDTVQYQSRLIRHKEKFNV
ncbi:pantetheine-phosphate adenylyltransferase [Mycoplasma sp. 005V]|uniref:pantetheine-phosphate adenylyltransferase n=1 Tax=unclassified Mycoplasma TaxID=2683645 RepID=UPI003A864824